VCTTCILGVIFTAQVFFALALDKHGRKCPLFSALLSCS
jgi:hypothetical protein